MSLMMPRALTQGRIAIRLPAAVIRPIRAPSRIPRHSTNRRIWPPIAPATGRATVAPTSTLAPPPKVAFLKLVVRRRDRTPRPWPGARCFAEAWRSVPEEPEFGNLKIHAAVRAEDGEAVAAV